MSTETLVSHYLSYPDTHCFSPIAVDLHSADEKLNPFVSRFFSLDNFADQINEKKVRKVNRQVLHQVLTAQYNEHDTSVATRSNIDLLKEENTFTITTGHQLCLFTGPLYFIYKIIHTINLAARLKERFPENNFVPVFWLASEDHDFAEVSSVNVNGERIAWEPDTHQAPVGRLQLDHFDEVILQLKSALGDGPRANELLKLVEKCYRKEYHLSLATRLLTNELFGKYGLVILDADDKRLKQQFAPIVQKDIREMISYSAVARTSEELSRNYKLQVHPRACNFFLFKANARKRIDKTDNGFELADTNISFTNEELLLHLETHPEDFSPNVIMRPLYQEFTLPNLAYIGGGGEQAYWLQLKGMFSDFDIPFPILVLRNSALLIEEDQEKQLQKIKVSIKQMFQPEEKLVKTLIREFEQDQFANLSEENEKLKIVFLKLMADVGHRDVGLQRYVAAELRRQENFFRSLETKLIRAGKIRHSATLYQLNKLRNSLFPNGGLQERSANILTYLFRYPNIIDQLVSQLDPENKGFSVIRL